MRLPSWITVGPVWSKLEGPPDTIACVREALTVQDPGAQHTTAFKAGHWDGRKCFVRKGPRGEEFLAGLTGRALDALTIARLPAPTVHYPAALLGSTPLAAAPDVTWRQSQLYAVAHAIRVQRCVIQGPTGVGKTEIGMEFIRRVNGKALWVTHTTELVRQTSERFKERLGVTCGIVQGPTRTDGQVIVGTVQTMARMATATRLDPKTKRAVPNPQYDPAFFAQFDVLVMDEVHHGGADTWQDVAKACTRAVWRLGLSGTVAEELVRLSPLALLKIEGALGQTLSVATTAELAEEGVLAKATMRILRCPPTTYPRYEDVREAVCPDWRDDPRGIIGKAGGKLFRETYQRGIIDNITRNRLIVETAARHAKDGDKFLVLCNRVPHAQALDDILVKRLGNDRALLLTGASDDDDRAAVLKYLKRVTGGAVLVCTPFFREGVDLPEIDAGFLAGGGESDIAVLQALGRMLRPRADKATVTIYDVADGRDASLPKDYLARHFWRSRLPLYRRVGFRVVGA